MFDFVKVKEVKQTLCLLKWSKSFIHYFYWQRGSRI